MEGGEGDMTNALPGGELVFSVGVKFFGGGGRGWWGLRDCSAVSCARSGHGPILPECVLGVGEEPGRLDIEDALAGRGVVFKVTVAEIGAVDDGGGGAGGRGGGCGCGCGGHEAGAGGTGSGGGVGAEGTVGGDRGGRGGGFGVG